MSQKLTQNFLKNNEKHFVKIEPKTEIKEEIQKPRDIPKFHVFLDENNQIHFEFDGIDNIISRDCALAIRFKLFEVIGEQGKYKII